MRLHIIIGISNCQLELLQEVEGRGDFTHILVWGARGRNTLYDGRD